MDPDSTAPSRRRSGQRQPVRLRGGLTVLVTDGRGHGVRDGGLGRWLTSLAPRSARGELGVALVADARMRVLNRSYRKKDYPTDVLSFPADPDVAPMRGPRALGDLVIATGVAARQAKEAGHSLQTELRILALHGLLHLLGYDHEDPADDGRMARTEARLLRKGGVKTGLINRAPSRIPLPASRKPRSGTSRRR